MKSERPCQVGGGSWSPSIYPSCLWSDFKNSFVWWKFVKIVINFYVIGDFLLSTVWPLDIAEVTKVSRISNLKQKIKFRNFLVTSMLYIYLKRTYFSFRIQIQTKLWFILWKFEKTIDFFHFWVKNKVDQVSSIANFLNFLTTKLKNGFAGSC